MKNEKRKAENSNQAEPQEAIKLSRVIFTFLFIKGNILNKRLSLNLLTIHK